MTALLDDTCARIQAQVDAWKGGYARLWEFSPSLDRLTIRLSCDDRPGNLHLICSPCVSISAPVHWEHCHLRIRSEDQLYTIEDANAGVRVTCRGLEVSENLS